MAAYPPPTSSEPIWEPTAFTDPTTSGITPTSGLAYFLGYPSAQGNNTLKSTVVTGTLDVDGVATFNSAQTFTETVDFNGAATFASTATFDGETTFNGDVGITEPLTVTGTSSFSATNTFTGKIISNNKLTIGNSTNSNSVNLTSDSTTANQLDVSGQVKIGNTTGSNTIVLSADASTNNQLDVAGNLKATSVAVNGGSLSFPSNGVINFNTNIATMNMLSSWPSSAPLIPSGTGVGIFWNASGGNGEVDFLGVGQAGSGGFTFYGGSDTATNPLAVANLIPGNISFYYNPSIASPGVPTAYPSTSSSTLASIGYVNSAVTPVTSYPSTSTSSLASVGYVNTAVTPVTSYPSTSTSSLSSVGYVNTAVSSESSYPSTSTTKLATVGYVNEAVTPVSTYPSTSTSSLASVGYVNSAVDSTSGNPVGTILMYGGYASSSSSTAPTDYLWCDGTAYSTTTYATLYAVLGNVYNLPSTASGYFCVPGFHQGTGFPCYPVASGTVNIDDSGGSPGSNNGALGVTYNQGVSATTYYPTIYNGNTIIQQNQMCDHNHLSEVYSWSYDYNTTLGGSSTTVSTITASAPNVVTSLMTKTNGVAVFSDAQTQGQYLPTYCSVQFIIKYQ